MKKALRQTLFALPFIASSLGCAGGGQRALGVMAGTINDPSNRTLRREIMKEGLATFCHEVTVHDAPLRLVDDSPAIGRFFPTTCSNRSTEDDLISVRLEGVGYAWTNVTKKSTFISSATVDYDADFRMSGSTMYVYFRTKRISKDTFQTRVIEQSMANIVNQFSQMGDRFGQQLLSQKLQEGFTVIRDPEGQIDFSLGFVEIGKRPAHPFKSGEGRLPYENTRVEIHQNQRDVIGPIEITEDNAAIFLQARVDGGFPIDVFLLAKDPGEALVKGIIEQPSALPLNGAPIFSEVVNSGPEYRKRVPVNKGRYYLVFDNTPSAGQVAPPMGAVDDRAAVVSYLVELGKAD